MAAVALGESRLGGQREGTCGQRDRIAGHHRADGTAESAFRRDSGGGASPVAVEAVVAPVRAQRGGEGQRSAGLGVAAELLK